MLENATIEGLKRLRLSAMAEGVAEQREQLDYADLSFEERLGLLVDRELLARDNRRLARLLKAARLKLPATVEDLDY
ncbi:MAG: ATP-binding protein, partial [Acidimicrobiales bacterium]